MDEQELAEIEGVILYSGESYLRYVVRKLIAEVRRLNAEVERAKGGGGPTGDRDYPV